VETLIKQLKKKDPKAQKQLFDQFVNLLYRICFRYLNDAQRCEEILSQVFLKIFNHIADTNIESQGAFIAWMKKIAINESLMEIRKKTWFQETLLSVEEMEITSLNTDSHLLADDLISLVMSLPNGYRTIFCLYAIEGYTHTEIANQLGISEGTSKSQLAKARIQLKRMITLTEINHETLYR
jgi:RNA polymerase sigma-70 factor (ECF subfamily)